ncbi:hypothetical protein EW146_g4578 [Bondarzewia mesenterica]|uniref:Uncharacterized protein n=1 Tax=Bondarzewia mesenterica TaxID=1095465 RepID=A0A4S4LUA2_9AGAM|nr:hypothetical protein EW146_g4578 [Bondarzewia mesenterica]
MPLTVSSLLYEIVPGPFVFRNDDAICANGPDPDFEVSDLTLLHQGTRWKSIVGKLKHLQGVGIPTCHGYLLGTVDEEMVGVLVLSYCGKPVEHFFSTLDPEFKSDLIDIFLAIHFSGVSHNDIAECNVLDWNGKPVVIDFEDSTEEECGLKMPIKEGALSPGRADFDCKELHQLCIDLTVWNLSVVLYGDGYHSVKLLTYVHKLAAVAPKRWSRERAYREAFETIEEHAQMYYPKQYEKMMALRISSEKPAVPSNDGKLPTRPLGGLSGSPSSSGSSSIGRKGSLSGVGSH